MTRFLNISTDQTLGGSNTSDEIVPSQKAIKAYVDSQTGTAPAFANITGDPTDNAAMATALNAKQNTLSAGFGIEISNNTVALVTEFDCGGVDEASTDEYDMGTIS